MLLSGFMNVSPLSTKHFSEVPDIESNRASYFAGLTQRIKGFLTSPVAPYLFMALLVLKVMWGMWDFKDLDVGDAISYYEGACEAFERGRVNIAWSPAFAVLGALILKISNDAYFYCTALRLLLVGAFSFLALAAMRRLLPPTIAWAVVAWWVLLPINFDTLYFVHMFGALPIVLSWVLLLSKPDSRNMRATVLGVAICCALLIRNEQTAYVGLLSASMLIAEVYGYLRESKSFDARILFNRAKPYLVAVAVVLLTVIGFYVKSVIRYPALADGIRHKHTNNVGQIYCFGIQQRHPGVWNKSCWTEYGDLMTKTFGGPELTLTESFVANPPAMTEHLMWNASLIPSGLQLMLFNRIAGGLTPDYIEPIRDSVSASWLSVLVLSIIGVGAIQVFRQRAFVASWVAQRRWGLWAMLCYVPVAFIVMVMQRPRTSYVFPFSLEIMGLVGFSLWLTFRGQSYKFSHFAVPLMVCAIVLAPSYYIEHKSSRDLLHYVRFLEPMKVIVEHNHGKVIVPDYRHEIAHYLYGMRASAIQNRFIGIDSVPELTTKTADHLSVLQREGITDVLFYQATNDGPNPCEKAVMSSPNWRLVKFQRLPDFTYSLYTQSKLYYGIDLAAKRRAQAGI